MNTKLVTELECLAIVASLHNIHPENAERISSLLREYATLLAKANDGAPEFPGMHAESCDMREYYRSLVHWREAQCVALRKQLAERDAEIERLKAKLTETGRAKI